MVNGWKQQLKPILMALGIVLIVRTVVAEPYRVPTPSMVPTLLVGDQLIGTKFAYGYGKYSLPIGELPDFDGRLFGQTPERGDVVVFRLPRDPSTTFVKRLIGLPGDKVFEDRQGFIWIDGKRLNEPYIQPDRRQQDVQQNPDYRNRTWLVPKRDYFFMGDNRGESCDSRRWGSVPRGNLIGKVIATYWPPSRISVQ